MAKITRFEELVAWQKARRLVAAVYEATENIRFRRDFALRDQIRSAAISVPSNIAEGFERNGLREFHQFLSTAKASCAEVRSDLYLAYDIGYIDEAALSALLKQSEEVGRITGGLRSSIARKLPKSRLRTQHSALSTPKT